MFPPKKIIIIWGNWNVKEKFGECTHMYVACITKINAHFEQKEHFHSNRHLNHSPIRAERAQGGKCLVTSHGQKDVKLRALTITKAGWSKITLEMAWSWHETVLCTTNPRRAITFATSGNVLHVHYVWTVQWSPAINTASAQSRFMGKSTTMAKFTPRHLCLCRVLVYLSHSFTVSAL